MVPHCTGQQQDTFGGTKICGSYEAKIRVLRGLIPHHVGHSVLVLQLCEDEHHRQLLPHCGGRVRVRQLQRRPSPLAQEADRDQEPGGDPRRGSVEILQSFGEKLSSSLAGAGQDDGKIHVQQILYWLSRPDGTTQQTLQVPWQPFSR